jgi:Ca2+-binding EF-hand superfamily protein
LASRQLSNDENLKEAFRVFDKNNDGYISRSELKKAMASLNEILTDEEVEEMIQEADLNGDGKINYEGMINLILLKNIKSFQLIFIYKKNF